MVIVFTILRATNSQIHMKKAFLYFATLGLLLIASSFSQNETTGVQWVDITKIDSLLKADPKPVFIDVRADWCGMCTKFDKTTLQEESIVKTLNENFYAVHFDFHDKRNISFNGTKYSSEGKFHSLAKQFEATGLPTLIFFDKDYNKIHFSQGYYNEKDFGRLLNEILEKEANKK